MREDMAKVIVERPRWGGGIKTPKGSRRVLQRIPLDELPARIGMGKIWRKCSKSLNENLAPLRRFLASKVGQPWNDVNSELRERIHVKSAVQLHIWQHVEGYVCLHPLEVEGQWTNERGYAMREPFFVNPRTGLLCRTERYGKHWRGEVKSSKYVIRIDDLNQYRKINGIWYELQLQLLPWNRAGLRDVVFNEPCIKIERCLQRFYHGPYYAVSKRQLNTKEIRTLVKKLTATAVAR